MLVPTLSRTRIVYVPAASGVHRFSVEVVEHSLELARRGHTATEIGLLGISATQAAQGVSFWNILVFPALFFADHSRNLSPFDPLLFAMLGARAMAMARLKQFDEAAEFGVKAAARPNAHAHILGIAAYSLALAGRLDEARAHMAAIHRTLPDYGLDNFLAAMQFSPEGTALFREAARRIG